MYVDFTPGSIKMKDVPCVGDIVWRSVSVTAGEVHKDLSGGSVLYVASYVNPSPVDNFERSTTGSRDLMVLAIRQHDKERKWATFASAHSGFRLFCRGEIQENYIGFRVTGVHSEGRCGWCEPIHGDLKVYRDEYNQGLIAKLKEKHNREERSKVEEVVGSQMSLVDKGLMRDKVVLRCEYGRRDQGKYYLVEQSDSLKASDMETDYQRQGVLSRLSLAFGKRVLKVALAEEEDFGRLGRHAVVDMTGSCVDMSGFKIGGDLEVRIQK